MKVAPVSADLMIKLALAAAVVGGAVYLANRARNAIGGVLPDVGAWVDSAGAFVGDVGSTLSDGAGYVADTFGGTAHNTNPATWDYGSSPAWNPYGVTMTPAQRDVYDAAMERGNPISNFFGWVASIGNQVPAPYAASDPVRDIRRIDNALGY